MDLKEISRQIEINMNAGMPENEASFQSGYSAGHDAGYERAKREIKPAGAVWVKASEFKPELSTHRPFRLKHDNGYLYGGFFVGITGGKVYLSDNGKYIEQHNDRWANYEILDESGTAAVQYESVFVPCAEDDPNVSGGYTSNDGRSLCYVKEVLATIKK